MDTTAKAYWLGHSAFKLESPAGKHILIDPFLSQNPKTPDKWKNPTEVDYILLTHGHEDHVGDTIDIAKRTGCKVVSIVELSALLKNHGLPEGQAIEMNKGGSIDFEDFSVTMTSANHSASFKGEYAGDPAGIIVEFDDDISIYHMGDTNIFYDLELYSDLYSPDIALCPIGDYYTMGPEEAAAAIGLLQPDFAVPIHYGTFPVLTGDPEDFKAYVEEDTNTTVWIPKVGENFLE